MIIILALKHWKAKLINHRMIMVISYFLQSHVYYLGTSLKTFSGVSYRNFFLLFAQFTTQEERVGLSLPRKLYLQEKIGTFFSYIFHRKHSEIKLKNSNFWCWYL